jgi:hypothetical protein
MAATAWALKAVLLSPQLGRYLMAVGRNVYRSRKRLDDMKGSTTGMMALRRRSTLFSRCLMSEASCYRW